MTRFAFTFAMLLGLMGLVGCGSTPAPTIIVNCPPCCQGCCGKCTCQDCQCCAGCPGKCCQGTTVTAPKAKK